MTRSHRNSLSALLLLSGIPGCFEPAAERCPGGYYCPPGFACHDGAERCVDRRRFEVCRDATELSTCTWPGAPSQPSRCVDGLCRPAGCGDAVLDPGEECEPERFEGGACPSTFASGTLGCTDCQIDYSGCVGGCGNGRCEAGETGTGCPQDCPNLDLLFIVDDSGGMEAARQTMTRLMDSLQQQLGALPSLHLGVSNTDLGAGEYPITYCEDIGGNEGHLLNGHCLTYGSSPYLVDEEPAYCRIDKDGDGNCTYHECEQRHCDHADTSETLLVQDAATGCPRCRNYDGEALTQTFTCMTDMGTEGCAFEQPLEAMRKALENHDENLGFLRSGSILAVVILTTEDDCSARDFRVFDPSQTTLDSELGPWTNFRCHEFGLTCDINDRTTLGVRRNCEPREDAGALLYPISDYLVFLRSLRPPERLVFSVIGGPVDEEHSVTVGLDWLGQPEVQYSCTTGTDGAMPGIRLYSLVEALRAPEPVGDAYWSVCEPDYTPVLDDLVQRIVEAMGK